jgi:PASTA domain-containing protein
MRHSWIFAAVTVVGIVLAGCGQQGSDEVPSGSVDRTERTELEHRTSVPAEHTRTGKPMPALAPVKNPNPIPDVVGMKVEMACRTLLRKEHLGYVWSKRHSDEFGTGRVVAQKPEPGFRPGVPHGVFLFVAKPFPAVLPRDTSCAERTVGPID